MKLHVLYLIVAFVTALPAADFDDHGSVPAPTGEKERFEIIVAKVLDGGTENPTVIRIDKFTGRCWRLNMVPISPGSLATVQAWVPIYEMDAPTIQEATTKR